MPLSRHTQHHVRWSPKRRFRDASLGPRAQSPLFSALSHGRLIPVFHFSVEIGILVQFCPRLAQMLQRVIGHFFALIELARTAGVAELSAPWFAFLPCIAIIANLPRQRSKSSESMHQASRHERNCLMLIQDCPPTRLKSDSPIASCVRRISPASPETCRKISQETNFVTRSIPSDGRCPLSQVPPIVVFSATLSTPRLMAELQHRACAT